MISEIRRFKEVLMLKWPPLVERANQRNENDIYRFSAVPNLTRSQNFQILVDLKWLGWGSF